MIKLKNGPDHLDALIGLQLRHIRNLRDMSQMDIGAALDLTYQQIQKYETGQNRIAASTIWRLSKALNVPVSDFFITLEGKPCK